MLIRQLVLRLCLDQGNTGLVQFLAWQGALIEKSFAAVVKLLFCLQGFLRCLQVQLGFLQILGQVRAGSRLVGGLRLLDAPWNQ